MSENNNKKNQNGLFSSKQVRSGGYSLIITAIVLALAVFANLIVYTLPSNITNIDMTDNGTFTLDGQSVDFVKTLDGDITIYYICQNGNENALIQELLGRYTSLSSRITVQKIDPVMRPNFTGGYTENALSDNSLIMESALRYKVIPFENMYYYYVADFNQKLSEYDYSNYYVPYYGNTAAPTFAGESEITSGLDYVTTTDIPVIYQLAGHGETALPDDMLDYLDADNFSVKILDLLKTNSENPDLSLPGDDILNPGVGLIGEIPEDADCIIINLPTKDLSEEELELFLGYVAGGGNLLISSSYTITDLPNFITLAASYGLDVNHSLVVDTNMNYYTQNPYDFLLPQKEAHEITDPIIADSLYVVFGRANGMLINETLPENVLSANSLLSTSSDAYAKASTAFEELAYDEEGGDARGPFSLGAAVTTTGGKVVWYSSYYVCMFNYYGNYDLYLNSLGWMTEKASSLKVRTISLETGILSITEATAAFWSVIVIGVIPLSVLAAGFIIWIGRRRR